MTGKSTAEKTARAAQAFTRRGLFKGATVAGGTLGAVVAASHLGMPYIGTAKGQTTTWKIQTSWPGGFGLDVFKLWANNIVEASGGELAFQPFGAKDVVGDFQLFDAVKNGVLQAMNPFTLYWAGRMPASVF
jgi:TRAP-type mannitol/chloroaromatic compound transport system substrate-binding protein